MRVVGSFFQEQSLGAVLRACWFCECVLCRARVRQHNCNAVLAAIVRRGLMTVGFTFDVIVVSRSSQLVSLVQ